MKLEIKDLKVSFNNKLILNGVSLVINPGEIHALMGPNGSGKSTLSYVLAGDERYKIESGDILINETSIKNLSPSERAQKGLFLSFQNPIELQGVSFSKLLFAALKQKNPTLSFMDFKSKLNSAAKKLNLESSFLDREANVGLSGGEKKKGEVLQLLTLKPELAILDELDSGLDIDSLQLLANAVNELKGSDFSALIITHYQRLLNYIVPDFVHILIDGKIVASGSSNLAKEIENSGYEEIVVK